jgi:hypothetical protein
VGRGETVPSLARLVAVYWQYTLIEEVGNVLE